MSKFEEIFLKTLIKEATITKAPLPEEEVQPVDEMGGEGQPPDAMAFTPEGDAKALADSMPPEAMAQLDAERGKLEEFQSIAENFTKIAEHYSKFIKDVVITKLNKLQQEIVNLMKSGIDLELPELSEMTEQLSALSEAITGRTNDTLIKYIKEKHI